MTPSKPPLLGADLLRAYIKRVDGTAYAFAKRTGIVCDHLLKVLRNERRRISVDLALDIQAGTNGEVPVAAWRMRAARFTVADVRPVQVVSDASSEAQPA